jgi:hypothetical protein
MKQRLLLAACATVLIAACSDGDRTGSDNPTAPGIVAFSHQGEPHACNFREAKGYAQNYFKLSGDRNAARAALSAADDAALGSTSRDDALFAVLELVAKVGGNTDLSNLPSDGAKLVSEVVDCGGDTWVVTDGRVFNNAAANVANALTDGAGGFAVVAGTSDHIGDATTDHVYTENGEAAFGLNSLDPTLPDTWADALGRSAVVLAELSDAVNFGLTQVVPNQLVYRVSLIYTGARPAAFDNNDMFAIEFDSQALPDVPEDETYAALVGRNRSSGNVALQQGDIAGFPSESSGLSNSSPTIFAQLLDRVLGVFRPTPLQAMMFVPPWSGSSGGQGTSLDDFSSDYSVVNVNAVNLLIVDDIPPVSIGQDFTFRVTATAGTSVMVENVAIEISVAGNQGDPVLLFGTGCGAEGSLTCTLTTEEEGEVTFTLRLNKAGGYTLQAAGSLLGITVNPDLSNLFIVSGN